MKATPVTVSAALGLVSSKVTIAAPLGKITAGSKALLIAGGAMTESVAEVAAPVPALAVAIGPVLLI